MRLQGYRRLTAFGLVTAFVGFGVGCSSGGSTGADASPGTRDLGMTMPLDLSAQDLRTQDLRRPPSSELSLGMPKTYLTGGVVTNLIVHDMNGDGLLDVVVSGRAGVLLGKGDGTFQTVQSITAATSSNLAAADLNGDAKTDLVLLIGSDALVLLGKGDGTFQAPLSTPLGGHGFGVAVGDVNRDGKVDLAIGIFAMPRVDNFVHVLPGLGNGSFGSPVKVQVGIRTLTVRLTDLNRDGKLDLAAANNDSNHVTVALGLGDGTFATSQNLSSERVPSVVDPVDMNLDGVPDLVVGGEYNESFSVHRGKGDGTFEMPQVHPTLGASIGLAAGDLNGDGVPDVVTCPVAIRSTFSVALGKGDGSFLAPRSFMVPDNDIGLALADFNRDGLADVVLAGGAGVHVLLNTTATP